MSSLDTVLPHFKNERAISGTSLTLSLPGILLSLRTALTNAAHHSVRTGSTPVYSRSSALSLRSSNPSFSAAVSKGLESFISAPQADRITLAHKNANSFDIKALSCLWIFNLKIQPQCCLELQAI